MRSCQFKTISRPFYSAPYNTCVFSRTATSADGQADFCKFLSAQIDTT